MVLDRSRLQNLSKANLEGFKDYAQRWHELETQMVTMFIDTLPSPFYENVVGSVASNFVDLVTIGERIESGIKKGKFAQVDGGASFVRKAGQEKQRGETIVVIIDPSGPQGQGKIILSNSRVATLLIALPKAETANTSNAQNTRPV
ncbi:hypothetical protein CR513_32340, partial [Mucuna pruriens]